MNLNIKINRRIEMKLRDCIERLKNEGLDAEIRVPGKQTPAAEDNQAVS